MSLTKNHPDGRRLGDLQKELRAEQLKKAGAGIPINPFPFVTDLVEAEGVFERRMHAAVILQAISDWATFSVCAFAAEQQMALEAYWWVMGFQSLMPPDLSQDALQDILANRQRSYRIPNGVNPLSFFGMERKSLWDPDGSLVERLSLNDELEALLHLGSFETCCLNTEIDSSVVRTRMHLIPPQ